MARATVAARFFLVLILIVILILISSDGFGISQDEGKEQEPGRPICRLLRGGFDVSSVIMFEKIKVQLPAAEEKVAHLRRFL
jgi:hypothetical protein